MSWHFVCSWVISGWVTPNFYLPMSNLLLNNQILHLLRSYPTLSYQNLPYLYKYLTLSNRNLPFLMLHLSNYNRPSFRESSHARWSRAVTIFHLFMNLLTHSNHYLPSLHDSSHAQFSQSYLSGWVTPRWIIIIFHLLMSQLMCYEHSHPSCHGGRAVCLGKQPRCVCEAYRWARGHGNGWVVAVAKPPGEPLGSCFQGFL